MKHPCAKSEQTEWIFTVWRYMWLQIIANFICHQKYHRRFRTSPSSPKPLTKKYFFEISMKVIHSFRTFKYNLSWNNIEKWLNKLIFLWFWWLLKNFNYTNYVWCFSFYYWTMLPENILQKYSNYLKKMLFDVNLK